MIGLVTMSLMSNLLWDISWILIPRVPELEWRSSRELWKPDAALIPLIPRSLWGARAPRGVVDQIPGAAVFDRHVNALPLGRSLVDSDTESVEYVTVDLDSDTGRLRERHLSVCHSDRTSYEILAEGVRRPVVLEHWLIWIY